MYTKQTGGFQQHSQNMTQPSVYWRGLEEKALAGYQQDQGRSNHCAKHAAASSINMLTGLDLDGVGMVRWLDDRVFKGTLRYTIFGNHNGSLVFQTANQIRWFSLQHQVPVQVKCRRGKKQDLIDSLKDGGAATLVSVTYFEGEEPLISRGRSTVTSLGRTRWIGGHVMILGAYDPDHKNTADVVNPWGFISSWGSPDQLYWMTERDFLRTWGRLSILNMITVRMG